MTDLRDPPVPSLSGDSPEASECLRAGRLTPLAAALTSPRLTTARPPERPPDTLGHPLPATHCRPPRCRCRPSARPGGAADGGGSCSGRIFPRLLRGTGGGNSNRPPRRRPRRSRRSPGDRYTPPSWRQFSVRWQSARPVWCAAGQPGPSQRETANWR